MGVVHVHLHDVRDVLPDAFDDDIRRCAATVHQLHEDDGKVAVAGRWAELAVVEALNVGGIRHRPWCVVGRSETPVSTTEPIRFISRWALVDAPCKREHDPPSGPPLYQRGGRRCTPRASMIVM